MRHEVRLELEPTPAALCREAAAMGGALHLPEAGPHLRSLTHLQRTIGNRAVVDLLATGQAGATLNQAHTIQQGGSFSVSRRAAGWPVASAPVVQRVDISGLTGPQKAGLVSAYRQDARSGGMWGRESDLAALARGLAVRVTVLDFSGDPSADTTDATYSYGSGREVFLKYSGVHYDVLEPADRGLYKLQIKGNSRRFRLAFPIAGDGNCMFASVWYAAYPEASNMYRLVNVADPPPRMRVDQGQVFLRDVCHGPGGLVSEGDIEHEISAMDNNLGDEHIGPVLANLLAATPGLAVKSAPTRDLSGNPVPKAGAQLTDRQAKQAFANFENAPSYWATLKWTMVGEDMYQADLPNDHKLFKDIEKSVSSGIEKRPYTSAAGEQTRMEVVRGNIRWLTDKAKKGNLSQTEQDQLAAAKNRLKEGQKGGPAAPRSRPVEIDRVTVIANKKLWNAYQAARQSVRSDLAAQKKTDPMKKVRFDGAKEAQLIDNTIAEVRLFHSTSPTVMDLLVKGGFNPAYSANKAKPGEKARYGPLGQGSYFADVISKAMTYSQCPVCSDYDCPTHKDAVSETLLTRVVLGNTKKAHSFVQSGLKMKDLRADDLGTLKEGRHTVYSEGYAGSKNAFTAGSGLNEFGVKDASFTYPEFRISYRTKR